MRVSLTAVDRRHFLALLSAGALVATAGCTGSVEAEPVDLPSDPPAPPGPAPAASGLLPPDVTRKAPLPTATITDLPGTGRHMALTVDDGASSEVVGAYVQWAKDTGARFTFFVTGSFDAWTDNRAALRPLVESGQIQLGNHTWTHPDLTALPDAGVADELRRTQRFLRDQYGVDGTPYYRPPFGYHNERVDRIAADLGYTVPTLWYGSLSDSGLITEEYLLKCARQYFQPQSIIIGHANHAPVTHVYPELVDIIKRRNLRLVTLDDYFEAPADR